MGAAVCFVSGLCEALEVEAGHASIMPEKRGLMTPGTPPRELRPFGEIMFRRRTHGIGQTVLDVPVGLFCFGLLYADGQDLTRLPYPARRAALVRTGAGAGDPVRRAHPLQPAEMV